MLSLAAELAALEEAKRLQNEARIAAIEAEIALRKAEEERKLQMALKKERERVSVEKICACVYRYVRQYRIDFGVQSLHDGVQSGLEDDRIRAIIHKFPYILQVRNPENNYNTIHHTAILHMRSLLSLKFLRTPTLSDILAINAEGNNCVHFSVKTLNFVNLLECVRVLEADPNFSSERYTTHSLTSPPVFSRRLKQWKKLGTDVRRASGGASPKALQPVMQAKLELSRIAAQNGIKLKTNEIVLLCCLISDIILQSVSYLISSILLSLPTIQDGAPVC